MLRFFAKIFEQIIFNNLIEYFEKNSLISPNISGFLLRGISKAFDRVWHEAFIFKFCQNGIYDDMVNILKEFLTNRKQRVILNGQCYCWPGIPFGASQYSIVWPLLFLIYINDISFGLKSEFKLFADDTGLFLIVHDVIISKNDQTVIYDCIYQWKMKLNTDLSKHVQEIIFSLFYPRCSL